MSESAIFGIGSFSVQQGSKRKVLQHAISSRNSSDAIVFAYVSDSLEQFLQDRSSLERGP